MQALYIVNDYFVHFVFQACLFGVEKGLEKVLG